MGCRCGDNEEVDDAVDSWSVSMVEAVAVYFGTPAATTSSSGRTYRINHPMKVAFGCFVGTLLTVFPFVSALHLCLGYCVHAHFALRGLLQF